jgi:hypothetical protein
MGSLYRSRHELIGVYKNGKASHRNNVQLGRHGRNRTNVWTYPGIGGFGRKARKAICLPYIQRSNPLRSWPMPFSTAQAGVILCSMLFLAAAPRS